MTHEEWFVGVQQKCFLERDETKWSNAAMWCESIGLSKRYASSEEEAMKVLNHALELWNGVKIYDSDGKRRECYDVGGGIGVAIVSTEKQDDDMRIVRYIIKKREVTDWEVIDKQAID